MGDRFRSRLGDISRSHSGTSDRWDRLKNLQSEVKSHRFDTLDEKKELLNEISSEFESLKSERKRDIHAEREARRAFAENSQCIYDTYLNRIGQLDRRISSVKPEDLLERDVIGSLVDEAKEIKDALHQSKSSMISTHKSLFGTIKESFEKIDGLRDGLADHMKERIHSATKAEMDCSQMPYIREELFHTKQEIRTFSQLKGKQKARVYGSIDDAINQLEKRKEDHHTHVEQSSKGIAFSFEGRPAAKRKGNDLIYDPVDLTTLVEKSFPSAFSFDGKLPHGEFRAQQVQYTTSCYEAIENAKDIVIEGPTGLGKTRALVAAVLPSIAEGKRVLYLTRTVTQVNGIMDTLNEIRRHSSIDFTASLYFSKNRVRDDFAFCYQPIEGMGDMNASRVENGLKELTTDRCNKGCKGFDNLKNGPGELTYKVIDVDFLKKNKERCPVAIYDKAAKEADIVVAPHGYAFDSHWIKRNFGSLEDVIVVVDEAHNFLEDCSSKHFLRLVNDGRSDRMNNQCNIKGLIDDAFKEAKKHYITPTFENDDEAFDIRACFTYLKSVERDILEMVQKEGTCLKDGSMSSLAQELSKKHLINLLNIERILEDTFDKLDGSSIPHPLTRPIIFEGCRTEDIYAYVQKYKETMQGYADTCRQLISSLARIAESPSDFIGLRNEDSLEFHPLHPRWNNEHSTGGAHSRIYTSATLSPTSDVSDLLGLQGNLRITIDPVFKDSNYLPFFVAGANSSPKGNGETFVAGERNVLEDIITLATKAASGKNIGIFCNNKHNVTQIYDILSSGKDGLTLLPYIKNGEDDENPYHRVFEQNFHRLARKLGLDASYEDSNVIELFRRMGKTDDTTVLLGVSGGSMAEGIDYKGEDMEMVINVGLPYPSNEKELFITEAKTEYHTVRLGDRNKAEDLAYKQDAFRKLSQTVGRANRSISDRAVIICLDERLLGLKNDGEDYEFLSMRNVRKNLRLLPRPMSRFNQNIVIPSYMGDDAPEMNDYLQRLASPRDFIEPKRMYKRIREFYHGAH